MDNFDTYSLCERRKRSRFQEDKTPTRQSVVAHCLSPIISEGLKNVVSLINHIGSFELVRDDEDLLDLSNRKKADIFILSIEKCDTSAINTLKILNEKMPQTRILIYTLFRPKGLLRMFLNYKVSSIVFRDEPLSELKRAIEALQRGETFFSKEMTEMGLREKFWMDTPSLTKRELDVLEQIANGLSSQSIADKLELSINTVETHRKHLMAKFEAANMVDLIRKAMSDGLVKAW